MIVPTLRRVPTHRATGPIGWWVTRTGASGPWAGALAIGTVMSVTRSVDHRGMDGALGAQFLDAFKGYLEDPLSMLM